MIVWWIDLQLHVYKDKNKLGTVEVVIVWWLDLQLHVYKDENKLGVVEDVIVWWLDLQLHMQSVYITIDVVISNPAQGEVYNIIR